MVLSYGLAFFCDIMLYLGGLGSLGLLRGCRPGFFRIPLLLLAGCCLSRWLTGRTKPWLHWLPVAVVVPCLFIAGNVAGIFAALPMLLYLPFYISENRRAPDYDYAADRFRHSLIIAASVLVLSAILRSSGWTGGLPYLFLFFTLNMTLLRLLRHDDRIARSRRFRIMNLAGVSLVCAVGFALSQPGIISFVRLVWLWFCDHVLLNLAALLLYFIELVLYGIGQLLSLIPGFGNAELPEIPMTMPTSGSELFSPQNADEVRALPPVIRIALQAMVFVITAALVFLLLKALARRVARSQTNSGTDERESLDDLEAPRPRVSLLHRSPESGVRHWYRRALLLIRARGGQVAPNMNTLQIERANSKVVPVDALQKLREVYLPVRYGGREASRADIARAKAAYDLLKKL